jgi:uncharacterized protein YgiM (DUF1202 family)
LQHSVGSKAGQEQESLPWVDSSRQPIHEDYQLKQRGIEAMNRILPIAAVAAAVALSAPAFAQTANKATGTVGTNVGNSMNQPMVVTTGNGNVHMQPNATSKILTTVPQGHQVTVVGTANGGAWAHVMVDGLDGYMDQTQLQKPAQ